MLGVLKPCKGGNPIPLTKPKMLVGRKSFCDIELKFKNVSSRHCELEFRDGFWYVKDLDSTNGTSINGKGCQHEWVKPGSILGIARHRFTLEYQATGQPKDEKSVAEVTSSSLADMAGLEPEKGAASGGRGPANRGHLIPAGGGMPIALKDDHMLVGRAKGCAIRLTDSGVSARHCELEFLDGYWLVRDLGSRNGTKVDGKKIEQKWLFPKSLLQISTLRFKIMYTPTPGAPIPKDQAASFTRGLLARAGLKRRN